jgi:hypothetical protein
MPYVKQEDRKHLTKECVIAGSAGELNFCITYSIVQGTFDAEKWFDKLKQYAEIKGISYQTYNEIMGVLTCAYRELRRRDFNLFCEHGYDLGALGQQFYDEVLIPYEDKKIKENGDVYK